MDRWFLEPPDEKQPSRPTTTRIEKQQPAIKAREVLVTPQMARQWLSVPGKNFRRLDERKVAQYAADIRAGKWHRNGESVKIKPDGQVADGQHRLTAIVETGMPVWIVVVFNVTDTDGIDRGKPRSFGQLLNFKGVPNGAYVAGVTRQIYLIHTLGELPVHQPLISDDVLLEFLSNRIDSSLIQVACHQGKEIQRYRVTGQNPWAAAMYLFTLSDAEKAERFHKGVATGADLSDGSPMLTLRNFLIKAKAESGRVGSNPSARFTVSVAIKAWNAWKANRRIKILKYLSSDPFPAIL